MEKELAIQLYIAYIKAGDKKDISKCMEEAETIVKKVSEGSTYKYELEIGNKLTEAVVSFKENK